MEKEDLYKLKLLSLRNFDQLFNKIENAFRLPVTFKTPTIFDITLRQPDAILLFESSLQTLCLDYQDLFTIDDLNRELENRLEIFIRETDFHSNEESKRYFSKLTNKSQADYLYNRKIVISIIKTIQLYSLPAKSNLTFRGSQTDFIELVVALHETEKVKTIDGKPLTRLELTNSFKTFFNLDIPQHKLDNLLSSKTNNRKPRATFMNELSKSFEAYCEKTIEKRNLKR